MKKTIALILVLALTMIMSVSAMAEDLSAFKSAKDPSEWVIAVVVKDMTNSWFDYLNQGVDQFAADSGLNAYQTGPTQTDAAMQIQVIEDLIAQGVDALCVVPTDPSALESVLKEAMDSGIVVVTHEAPSQQNTLFDVESINNISYAEFHAETLAQAMGGEGTYVTMVANLEAETHNLWADACIEYLGKNYPNIQLLEDFPKLETQDNSETAYEKTKELLKAYPDVKGILAFGSPAGPGACRAIEELGLTGQIKVIGGGILSENKDYLESGSLLGYVRWAAEHAGYAMCSIAAKILAGDPVETGVDLGVDGFNSLAFMEGSTKVIEGNDVVYVTAENMNDVIY